MNKICGNIYYLYIINDTFINDKCFMNQKKKQNFKFYMIVFFKFHM